ncbi:transposase [Sansalvadorimonas verongulae]|uniref:transposase n=1 Tax=Sansalvadorimonas verongulae TaxID=2172824 RepID=UPI0012BB663C|nr:transposase [Sansalvadorimonas verongulae]MTI11776.1 transposase [Sansalvadorimonas verongulae]
MTATAPKSRKHLCADSLIRLIHETLSQVPDHRPNRVKGKITLTDAFMSAFAMMHLKYATLLDFDREARTEELQYNLSHLYRVQGRIPCDTHMREILDPVDPIELRKPYKKLFAQVQRGGQLDAFKHPVGEFKNLHLLAVDGTGLYYSGKCRCQECCVKNEGKPSEAYYHQMLAACLVHPDRKVVLPLAPEPIVHQDGSTKNDCEKNALKRLLAHTKREHPHLELAIVLDGLYADAPTIELIKSYGWHFIIVAKDGNHGSLVEAMDTLDENGQVKRLESCEDNGTRHWYRYAESVPLNKSDPGQVNVLDYVETDKKGQRHTWCWVTDLPLNEETVYLIMKGGRSRWRIENETFNTLKNHGYNLEHNYGHGKQHLATNMAYLTILAFLVDQIQQLACPQFQKALSGKPRGARVYLWKMIIQHFQSWLIESWDELFTAMIQGQVARRIQIDTS